MAVVSLFGFTIFMNRQGEQQQQAYVRKASLAPRLMVNKHMVEVRTLAHEAQMQKTIRDCLPSNNKKCMTFVPDPIIVGGDAPSASEKVQRVALIYPPGMLTMAVKNHMDRVAKQFNGHDDNHRKGEPKIQVIQTTHVPPYGYGKSHGLTKIVKLMPQPTLLQVVDALQASALNTKQRTQDITLQDLQVGLLQIMRFHCRLSHVAAHTASLTMDRATLVNATQLALTLRDYMAPPTHKANVGGGGDDEDDNVATDDDEFRVWFQQESVGASVLTRLSEDVAGSDLLALLGGVMQAEMARTQDMSVWPCPSFWDAPTPLQLSPITRELAKALSPDCSDPYVKCFVKKDKCEAAADPVCKK